MPRRDDPAILFLPAVPRLFTQLIVGAIFGDTRALANKFPDGYCANPRRDAENRRRARKRLGQLEGLYAPPDRDHNYSDALPLAQGIEFAV